LGIQSFKIYLSIFSFIIIQRDGLLMYHKFDYKLKKSILITCTSGLLWRKK